MCGNSNGDGWRCIPWGIESPTCEITLPNPHPKGSTRPRLGGGGTLVRPLLLFHGKPVGGTPPHNLVGKASVLGSCHRLLSKAWAWVDYCPRADRARGWCAPPSPSFGFSQSWPLSCAGFPTCLGPKHPPSICASGCSLTGCLDKPAHGGNPSHGRA